MRPLTEDITLPYYATIECERLNDADWQREYSQRNAQPFCTFDPTVSTDRVLNPHINHEQRCTQRENIVAKITFKLYLFSKSFARLWTILGL